MRILLDYRPALRQRTGVGQYVHELGTALQAHLSPADSLILFSSSWKDRLPATVVPAAGRVDFRIPVSALNLAWHRLEWPPAEMFAGPIDIAHSAHPLLMPARRALQVVTIYDLDFLDHPERTRAEVRRDYPVLAEQHARRADLVVVISEYTSQMVQARFGIARDRIVVCHPGAPPSPPVRSRSGRAGPILFVGTLEPRKNLPALLAAYERVVARRPDAPPLVLAGKQVEQSASILATLDAKPSLKDRVRQLGYVPDADREKLYEEASMLVLPSLDEGFGMTAVEAMQAGVPVVASRRGALPEVVGDAGLLVDPVDETGLADAIASLLASPERRLHYSEAGRVRARSFSWSASAARLLDAYRHALANRNAGHPQ